MVYFNEDQDETVPVQMAYAKGARMFERHIGVETNDIKLNLYSSKPEQITKWLKSLELAKSICGEAEHRHKIKKIETESLNSLKRGVYCSENISRGESILKKNMVYFAMPLLDGQLSSGDYKDDMISNASLKHNEPLKIKNLKFPKPQLDLIFKKAIHEVKGMLNEGKIFLNTEFKN